MECRKDRACKGNHDQDIGFIIKQITESIRRNVDNNLTKYGLTMTQSHVLFYLSCCGREKVSQKDIERHLQVTHPTVAGIIKRLEEKNFVITRTDSEDHRVSLVELTEQSRQLISRLKEGKQELMAQLTQGLNQQEQKELLRLLLILRDNVKEDSQLC
ncbi:MAG TPA: MarR family transcriptional regulator [Lachnospiraceae bacterium]|nr:MarR family transcriptional regulator [Lachnospiraceae bacterium]